MKTLQFFIITNDVINDDIKIYQIFDASSYVRNHFQFARHARIKSFKAVQPSRAFRNDDILVGKFQPQGCDGVPLCGCVDDAFRRTSGMKLFHN